MLLGIIMLFAITNILVLFLRNCSLSTKLKLDTCFRSEEMPLIRENTLAGSGGTIFVDWNEEKSIIAPMPEDQV